MYLIVRALAYFLHIRPLGVEMPCSFVFLSFIYSERAQFWLRNRTICCGFFLSGDSFMHQQKV